MRPFVTDDACIGCGGCEVVCPTIPSVFEVKDGLSKVVHPDACLDCGECTEYCPTKAIEVRET